MRRKKWVIPLCAAGVLALLCAGGLWYLTGRSMGFTVGRCLVAENGACLLIAENSPIVLNGREDQDALFSGLETGDKILVLHDGVTESYPGQTGAYWCMKLAGGTRADIPEQVISELAGLGWIFAGAPEPEEYAFEAQYVRTNGWSDEAGYPYCAVISSRAELEAYYEAYRDRYDLERRDAVPAGGAIGFLDACDRYDDRYFEGQDLVLIVLEENSGSIRDEITGVRRRYAASGAFAGWDISIGSGGTEEVTDDMAQWHLFLEVQAGGVIRPGDPVWINGELIRQVSVPSGLIGVSRTPADEAYQDPWGVKLTARDITPTGLTLVCTQWDGEPAGALNTGGYYALEALRDGAWSEVGRLPLEGGPAWTSEAWAIPANAETRWDVDWTRLYGALPAGSYRISKSVMDVRETGDYDTRTYYAGFDLVDGETADSISYGHGGYGVSLPYVPGWEYQIGEYSGEGMSWGVSFRPAGEDGWIAFHYWPSFGVCGTGLETEEYGSGVMGTYDGRAVWDFISYPASRGKFVAVTQGVDGWWPGYGAAAMEIIRQAVCTDTIID